MDGVEKEGEGIRCLAVVGGGGGESGVEGKVGGAL